MRQMSRGSGSVYSSWVRWAGQTNTHMAANRDGAPRARCAEATPGGGRGLSRALGSAVYGRCVESPALLGEPPLGVGQEHAGGAEGVRPDAWGRTDCPRGPSSQTGGHAGPLASEAVHS